VKQMQRALGRRGIVFYRRRRLHFVLPSLAMKLGWRSRSFYAFRMPERFDTAKTLSRRVGARDLQ
jgi:hypothetical protein